MQLLVQLEREARVQMHILTMNLPGLGFEINAKKRYGPLDTENCYGTGSGLYGCHSVPLGQVMVHDQVMPHTSPFSHLCRREFQPCMSLCRISSIGHSVQHAAWWAQSCPRLLSLCLGQNKSGQPGGGPNVPLVNGGVALVYAREVLLSSSHLHVHSTLEVATSWTLFMEVSVQDLCAVQSWSSPLTFVHYYMLRVFALVMEQAV